METKVVIWPAPKKEWSDGGIKLPDDAQRPEIHGVLMFIGPKVPKNWGAKEGDHVVYPQHAGTEIILQDEDGEDVKLLVMHYEQIIGILS